MCGLLFASNKSITESKFKEALALMKHRGPDAVGGYSHIDCWQLGHNRLSILDLDARSNQPFTHQPSKTSIVFNGEIYNYKELIEKYQLSVKTKSDTEVLLALYGKIGVSMLDELRGMFAFVIVNQQAGSVFIARDRLGVKPLYYTETGDGEYVFSSEIKPILELCGTKEFDEYGLRQYKKLRTFFNGRTIYKDIHMFPAGYYMLDGKMIRYWELPRGAQTAPEDHELKRLIEEAISYRCIADVEVGSYLSGGVDSTIVSGVSKTPHTWTVGTIGNNEFKWSSEASRSIGSIHHEVVVEDGDFLSIAREMIIDRAEPLSVPNEVLLYQMTKEVKKYNTVVLSGEGADELFFGYDRIFTWASSTPHFDLSEFDKLYSYGSFKDDEIIEDALKPFMDRGSALDIVAAFFQVAHLHGLLRRLDNSTMRCSVEARVPFVDHILIERMAGVPFDYRMQDGIVKAPLKRIFADILPQTITNRKKVGFPVDLENIFKNYGDDNESAMDKWLNFNLEVLGVKKY